MEKIILILLAIIPVIIIGAYIYKKDKNKEPKSLLIKLFLGGILSCFLVLFLTSVLSNFIPFIVEEYSNQTTIELLIRAFIGVAFIEEFSKWLIVYFFSYNNKEFDEIYDMIIYCVFATLGFAFFEDLFYIFQHGIRIAIIRGIFAIPAHTCNGIFMGYYLAMAKYSTMLNDNIKRQKYLILSIIVPMLCHGIFDFCLFEGNIPFFIIFLVFVIVLYVKSINKVISVSRNNKKITN